MKLEVKKEVTYQNTNFKKSCFLSFVKGVKIYFKIAN